MRCRGGGGGSSGWGGGRVERRDRGGGPAAPRARGGRCESRDAGVCGCVRFVGRGGGVEGGDAEDGAGSRGDAEVAVTSEVDVDAGGGWPLLREERRGEGANAGFRAGGDDTGGCGAQGGDVGLDSGVVHGV